MNERTVIKHWVDSATEDLKTAEALFDTKRYQHCLFFCHLMIEKILKAVYIAKKHTAPPWTHDLGGLTRQAGLVVDELKKNEFDELSRFNIAARYNDEKLSFYKIATRGFTKEWLQKAKEIYIWLKSIL